LKRVDTPTPHGLSSFFQIFSKKRQPKRCGDSTFDIERPKRMKRLMKLGLKNGHGG
jgi:hypothetical protein